MTSLVALLPVLMGGCAVIPRDGPTGDEVRNAAEVKLADASDLSYALVNLTPLVVRHIQDQTPKPVLFRAGINAPAPTVRVGTGDIVTVTIFEAQAGGLFIPGQPGTSAGNFVTLPVQQVDPSGRISVPYAGAIQAVGRTPAEIAADIENRLRERAIEPQVVVNVNERRADEVSVLGEVNGPARFAIDPGGVRLLNALARAGGSRWPDYETVITIQRDRRVDQALLTSVVANPAYNINLSPGDVVFVSREQRFFLVFGATNTGAGGFGAQSRRFTFEAENLTLAEAVARGGGLANNRADPRSVFLFRTEPRRVLEQLGVDVSRFKEPLVPTVYTVDLSDTQGYFLANSFYMRHRDVIYISDSPSVDLLKILDIVRAGTGAVGDIAAVRNDLRSFGR